MALIKCSDCEREVSDRAKSCPHCGCPVANEIMQGESEQEILYNKAMQTGIDWEISYNIGAKAFEENRIPESYEIFRKLRAEHPGNAKIAAFFGRVAAANRELEKERVNTLKCPRCGSKSITPMKKGYSVTAGLGGALLAGPYGLLAGALNSNKICHVCQNCSHRW